MELSCQQKFNPLASSQEPKTWPQMFETEPIVAANLQTGRRRTGMGSMQVISPDTTFALGSHSFVVAALGTGQRPPTANRTPPLDWLR